MPKKNETLFSVKFSNQSISFSNQSINVNDLITGELDVYATSPKTALKKVAQIVSVPGGAYFLAVPKAA